MLELFRSVRAADEHVGLCLQADLCRMEDDLEVLLPVASAIRLVKGPCLEQPSVAYASKVDVDAAAYLRLCEDILSALAEERVARPAFGTHDPVLIHDVVAVADRVGVSRSRWEVEMLYGIETREQDLLPHHGCPMRVLVSYGTH
jgi:proline dehydrogenase